MPITRVQKYKNYRNSLIKEDAPVLETTISNSNINNKDKKFETTTSTLPLDEVISAASEEKEEDVFIKRRKRNRFIKTALLVFGILVIVSLIVILGICLFK